MGATKKKPRQKRATAQEELPLNTQPTLAEMVRWYVEDWAPTNLRRRTLGARRGQLAKAVAELPPRPTSESIRAWLAGRVLRGDLAGTTANLWLRVLGRLYRLAQQLVWPGLLNVVAAIKFFPVVKVAPKALPDAEEDWRRCLAACRDVRERAFLSVMRERGLRLGEALGLEPRHVDLGRGTLTVEQQRVSNTGVVGPLKSDTSAATMRLDPDTAELLRQVLADHRARARGLRAVGTGQRGAAAQRFLFPYFTRQLEELLTRLRAAVPAAFTKRAVGTRGGAAFHVFRHTFATDLATRGMRTEKLQQLLRHKSFGTTQVYIGSIRGREMPEDELAAVWAARKAEREAKAPGVLPGDDAGNTTGSVLDVTTRGKRGAE